MNALSLANGPSRWRPEEIETKLEPMVTAELPLDQIDRYQMMDTPA